MRMLEDLERKIEELLKPLLEQCNLVGVDLVVKRRGRDIFVEVIIDRPTGGISMEECTMINKNLNSQMELDPLFAEGYTLEVSSPGLDRPLMTMQDFLRVKNESVHFILSASIHHKIEHIGVVKGVVEEQVVIDEGGQGILIPLRYIRKAVLVLE